MGEATKAEALVEAVHAGDTARVAALLDGGADANGRNELGELPLFEAVRRGQHDTVRLLLKARAKPNLQSQTGATALLAAADAGSVDLVRQLVRARANVNFRHSSGVTAIILAVQRGSEEMVDVLLDAGADVQSRTWTGVTPILAAAEQGNIAIASRLLNAGADILDVDQDCFGVLHYAAKEGHVEMLDVLVESGARVDTVSETGATPLHCAFMAGQKLAVAALLAEKYPYSDETTLGSCLLAAASEGFGDVVNMVLASGANVHYADATTGATALYVAAANGHTQVARQLVRAGATLFERAWDGSSPVTAAAKNGHADTVRMLQDFQRKVLDLFHASRHGRVDDVRMLLLDGGLMNKVDDHGNTLVHLAVLGGHDALLAFLLEQGGVQTKALNKFGESAMDIALKSTNQARIDQLFAAQDTTVAEVPTRSLAKLREIGRGAYSIIFKDTLGGQDVAVKVYRRFGTEFIRNEIQVLKDTPSPYIVRLLATADVESDLPQLIFEYMDGGNLATYLEERAKGWYIPVEYTPIMILWVVANALRDLHKKDVVHRDIKPDNILLSSTGNIKVADLGTAKKKETYMTTGAGTSKWRAPEVLTCGSSYGTPADIYSFGILLQTLYPDPLDASESWVTTLAAECTDVDPTHRPTAAKLVDILQPLVQMRDPQLMGSLPAFLHDQKVGPPAIDIVSINPTVLARKLDPSSSPLKRMPERFLRAIQLGDVAKVVDLLDNSGVDPNCASATGETGLIVATCLGHCDIVSVLLARGANVNAAQIARMTALHAAAQRNNCKIMEMLLAANANIDVRESYGQTPLHLAISKKNKEAIDVLLQVNANVNAATNEKDTPLHYATKLQLDAVVAQLIARGADVNGRDIRRATPLLYALQNFDEPSVTSLVQSGADLRDVKDHESALQLACRISFVAAVPIILAHGADVNTKHKGLSPLRDAIMNGRSDVVAALLTSSEININEIEHGISLLHLAVIKHNITIARLLLSAGVDTDVVDPCGFRAIKLASALGNQTMYELLLPASNHRDQLLAVAQAQELGPLKALLRLPFSVNVRDEFGCSLVHLAVQAKNEAMLDVLLSLHPSQNGGPMQTLVENAVSDRRRVRPACRLTDVSAFSSPFVIDVVATEAPDVVFVEPTDGRSLRQALVTMSCSVLPEWPSPKLHIAIAMARALVDLHAAGLFHGSLSSHSVFLGDEHRVKVGVPGTTDPSVSMLPWTSPERLGMFVPSTPEADVYALGIILTELDTLRAPFEEENCSDAQLMTAVGLRGRRPQVSDGCEPRYAALVDQCLAADPTCRPTAAAIVATLSTLQTPQNTLDVTRAAAPCLSLDRRNYEGKTPLAMAIERGYSSMVAKLFDRVYQAAVEISEDDYDRTTTELGLGGFSVVYLGSYMGQKVAIKKIRRAYGRELFETEADALVACPSPYLVRLVAIAGRHSETPALLLEYMDGGSLQTHLDQKRLEQRLSVNVTSLQVAWVVANALRDLHAKGIMHRDIKSLNVLLSTSGEIKLSDLGTARPEATEMTEVPGTRFWMAPEMLRADGTSYGLPADIYAFGVLLTELDTCQLPYFDQDVQNPMALVRGVVDGSLRPTLTTKCELWLRRLAEMCLLGDPVARPTANQIVEMLQTEMAAAATSMGVMETYLRAVARDDVITVTQLLKNSNGASLLLAATTARATQTVQFLLDRGVDVNDMRGGRTPLHEAASKSLYTVLSMLLDAGANVNARDNMGRTPLAWAVSVRAKACIKLLLATGSDIHDGRTPLEMAQQDKVLGDDVVRMLEFAASQTKDAVTPKIFCIVCGNWHPVEAVCGVCGHDASTTDRMAAVVRRLIQLHYSGYSVRWIRMCVSCRDETMAIVDTRCPKCAHPQREGNELGLLRIRLKMALRSSATNEFACDVPAIPPSVLRWLAR